MAPEDRRKGEGKVPYDRFRDWLAFDPPRPSHRDFAQHAGISAATVRRYSSRWKWGERARAYDQGRGAMVMTAEEMRGAHAKLWREAMNALEQTLAKALAYLEEGDELTPTSLATVGRMLVDIVTRAETVLYPLGVPAKAEGNVASALATLAETMPRLAPVIEQMRAMGQRPEDDAGA